MKSSTFNLKAVCWWAQCR